MSEAARHGAPAQASPVGKVAAIFDVDGTLTRSDIFRDLVAFRSAVDGGRRHAAFMATLPLRAAALLVLDHVSREAVNRLSHSWHEGFSRDELARWADAFQRGPGMARVYPRALELLALHAGLGHRLVLVTGAVDLLVLPLVRLLEDRLAARLGGSHAIRLESVPLVEAKGRFTGELAGAPLGGLEKARRVKEVAREEGIDLSCSFSYGDSIADVPLLSAVGRPAAVNPDLRLRLTARRRGWPVLDLRGSRTP